MAAAVRTCLHSSVRISISRMLMCVMSWFSSFPELDPNGWRLKYARVTSTNARNVWVISVRSSLHFDLILVRSVAVHWKSSWHFDLTDTTVNSCNYIATMLTPTCLNLINEIYVMYADCLTCGRKHEWLAGAMPFTSTSRSYLSVI